MTRTLFKKLLKAAKKQMDFFLNIFSHKGCYVECDVNNQSL